jgi:hypothetical protein
MSTEKQLGILLDIIQKVDAYAEANMDAYKFSAAEKIAFWVVFAELKRGWIEKSYKHMPRDKFEEMQKIMMGIKIAVRKLSEDVEV